MNLPLTTPPWKTYGLLGSLYLSQGLPYGFFYQALPVMMRKSGLTLTAIGLSSLVALPWALKFLWAPWVDRLGFLGLGRRKGWILPLQGLTALSLVLASFLEPVAYFHPLLFAVFVVNALSATQDVATDGWAVELLSFRERGLANGLQVAAYRMGMVLAGGLLLAFYDTLGWRLSCWAVAGALVLASLPAWFFPEAPLPDSAPPTKVLETHFLRRPGVFSLLALLFVFKFGESMASGMLRPYLFDLGESLSDIGRRVGTYGFLAALLGAGVGGFLASRLSRKKALLLGAFLQAASVGGYAWLLDAPLSPNALTLLISAEHFTSALATAALFTCMMDFCRRTHGGADYTVQASTVVIAQMAASAVSGFSAQSLGYAGHFQLSFVLCGVALGQVAWRFPRQPSAAFG